MVHVFFGELAFFSWTQIAVGSGGSWHFFESASLCFTRLGPYDKILLGPPCTLETNWKPNAKAPFWVDKNSMVTPDMKCTMYIYLYRYTCTYIHTHHILTSHDIFRSTLAICSWQCLFKTSLNTMVEFKKRPPCPPVWITVPDSSKGCESQQKTIQGAEHEHFLIQFWDRFLLQFWDHFWGEDTRVFWLVIALVLTGGKQNDINDPVGPPNSGTQRKQLK